MYSIGNLRSFGSWATSRKDQMIRKWLPGPLGRLPRLLHTPVKTLLYPLVIKHGTGKSRHLWSWLSIVMFDSQRVTLPCLFDPISLLKWRALRTSKRQHRSRRCRAPAGATPSAHPNSGAGVEHRPAKNGETKKKCIICIMYRLWW